MEVILLISLIFAVIGIIYFKEDRDNLEIELKQYLKAILYKIKNNKIEINENDKTINTEGREIEITRYPEMKKEQLKLLNNVKKI